MEHFRRVRSVTFVTILSLYVPWAECAQTPVSEDGVRATTEPRVSLGIELPDQRANIRDRQPAEDQSQRIISLDTLPELSVVPSAPARVTPQSSSGWKWLAIGAGAAGAAVLAVLAGRQASVSVRAPGGTNVTPVALVTPDITLPVPEGPALPTSDDTSGPGNGKAKDKGNR